MHHYTFSYSFDHVPPILKRGRQALIVAQDPEGNYILGQKNMYPEGISRFVGGGINPGEVPVVGAVRELKEELGIQKTAADLTELAIITITATETETSEQFTYILYLYQLTLREPLLPADDLDGIITLTPKELAALIEKFKALDSSLNDLGFRWSDYGTFFSEIHQIGLELTHSKQ